MLNVIYTSIKINLATNKNNDIIKELVVMCNIITKKILKIRLCGFNVFRK